MGEEASVRAQLHSLIDAGATDVWAAIVPVGQDPRGSVQRTTDLLKELLD